MEKDDKLLKLLKEKEIPELNPLFEELMMKRIYQLEPFHRKERNYIKLIILFLSIGFIFGFIICKFIFNTSIYIERFGFTIPGFYLQLPIIVTLVFLLSTICKSILYAVGKIKILEL